MPPQVLLTTLVAGLSLAGLYTTWGLADRNGFFAEMTRIRDVGPWKLPGSDLPLVRWYTGTDPIDYQLTVLQVFFANVVDGSSPPLSLFSFQFGGTYMAVMTVLLMEAFRDGHKWRAVSFFATWGLLFQNFGYAVIVPLYCAIHLSISPTMRDKSRSSYIIPKRTLAAIPWSVVLGYILPTVLMCLPQFTNKVHQYFVAFWQPFPVWMIIIQYTFEGIIGLLSSSCSATVTEEKLNIRYRKTLRRTYIFAGLSSTLIHLVSIVRFLAPLIKPGILKDTTIEQLSFSEVFIPPRPDSTAQITEFAQGALHFLQYDEYVGTLAVLIWVVVLNIHVSKRSSSVEGFISLLVKVAGLCVLAGPGTAIVALIWERDEIVLDASDSKQKKTQ